MSLASRVDRLSQPEHPVAVAPSEIPVADPVAPELATREITQRIVDLVRDALQDTRSALSFPRPNSVRWSNSERPRRWPPRAPSWTGPL